MADREIAVGEDNVVEVDSPQDAAAAHRHHHHKVMEAVSMGLAYWVAEEVGSCCATLRRSRLPTYDERNLVVGGHMN